jgi:hypothetical protein
LLERMDLRNSCTDISGEKTTPCSHHSTGFIRSDR